MVRWKFNKNLHWVEKQEDWPRYICNDLHFMQQQLYYRGPSYGVYRTNTFGGSGSTEFVGSLLTFDDFLDIMEESSDGVAFINIGEVT